MRQRVLVVDDDPVLARTLVRVLADRFDVSRTTAESAIEELTRTRFDAVVTDVLMPSCDGVQLYRWIRNARPKLAARVVFMSGLDRDAIALRLGGLPNPVLYKPFDREAVLAALERVLSC
jgi:CheY-like chemotaxis protein